MKQIRLLPSIDLKHICKSSDTHTRVGNCSVLEHTLKSRNRKLDFFGTWYTVIVPAIVEQVARFSAATHCVFLHHHRLGCVPPPRKPVSRDKNKAAVDQGMR